MGYKTGFAALGFFAILAGCSNGPTDADIKAALEKDLEASPLSKLMSAKVVSAKQIGCSKDKEGAAYVCDLQTTIEMKNPLTSNVDTKDGTEKLRFVKTDKGWVISR